MAVLAITLMSNDSKNNTKVENHGGQKKAAGHLRIIDAQRAARRTMHGLFQDRRMVVVHGAHGLVKVVLPHLDAMRDPRRAEKQKALEQLVVPGARVNVAIAEECFKKTTVLDVLKDGHGDPWLVPVRIHT